MMKADHTLSTLLRQLRPSLRQPQPARLHLRPLSQLAPLLHTRFPRPSLTIKHGIPQPPFPLRSLQTRRVSDSTSAPSAAVGHSPDHPIDAQSPPEKEPSYELTFTCKPCRHRSTHRISKRGYYKGTVMITCPECSNRHIISDHLKFFRDQSFTIEDLMRQKGQLVKRGTLGGKGDVEFWDDGSETKRKNVEGSQ